MSRPFSSYTDAELVGIDNETLNIAIRVEAINRGIKPPITISEALRRSEWVGYQKPAEAIRVYRIRLGFHDSPFAWLDESKAQAALDGMVQIESIGYSAANGFKISDAKATVETVWVGVSKGESKAVKFEDFFQDDTEFQKVVTECMDRCGAVHQSDYNRRVNSEKRTEYMRLAGGNEEIARAFWSKTERTEFPTE